MRTVFLFLFVGLALSTSNLIELHVECPEQYVPDPNRICIKPDFIEGCLLYKNGDTCDTCYKEYQPDNGKCKIISESSKIPSELLGCLKRSEDGKCLNCANGFRRINDKCVAGVKECMEYNSNGYCQICNPEYSLIYGKCRHNLLLGCKVELNDHRCKECFAPFELQEYNCGIRNCKRYNDYGCYACECGFYITENRACKKYEDGCMKYKRGICTECMPHFKLRGGMCMIDGCLTHKDHMCVDCKEDYDLLNGVCQFKNCFDWEEDRCLVCKEGFNVVDGKCEKTEKKYVCEG